MPVTAAIALLFGAQTAAPGTAAPIEGQWRSPGGNSIIALAPCGSDLCGTVVWASAQAKKDAAKTTDKLVGTQLLTAVQSVSDGRWQGRLFIPDKNMRVTAKIKLAGPAQLRVSSCLAGKALCKAALWTRVEGPLPASD